jgi:pSer/pThr/pTyr-binding forkhead associated (FHA) protein
MPQAPGGDVTRVLSTPPEAAPPAPGIAYGEATQQAITTTCPVCRTPNPPTERYCQDCGLMFGSVSGEIEALPDASQLPRLIDPATGREFPLNPGVNTVGRESADILIADPTISRRHGQVTLEAGQVVVEDLGSTNGTRVSDRPVPPGERETAFDGDTLRFGNVTLTLTLPGGEARSGGAPVGPAAAAPEAAPPPVDRGAPVGRLVLANGTEFPLYEGTNTIGRRSGNQIVLADAFSSGKHAEIRCEADGSVQLVDLGSSNGTFLAGERLAANAPVMLTDGTTVTMGKSEATYYASPPAPAPSGGEATLMARSEATLLGGPPTDDFPAAPEDTGAEGGMSSAGS